MNFLFHLHLSGEDPDILSGNLMGDFVKGRIGNEYPALLQQGIKLHRKIDVFAQNNSLFCNSRYRINRDYGLWRGILVDLYYDHFLATEWQKWSDVPFEKYLQQARSVVELNWSYLPERLQEMLPFIFDELLPSYRKVEGIGLALERMSRRVRRANPLTGGEFELVRNYDGLREDFCQFLPLVREFAQQFVQNGL
ncbi:MAG TPA: ACP phosphodiesterase [Desulfuromonadaceae bacterium]|jgi:acyl carrier protein phosphodiesterase